MLGDFTFDNVRSRSLTVATYVAVLVVFLAMLVDPLLRQGQTLPTQIFQSAIPYDLTVLLFACLLMPWAIHSLLFSNNAVFGRRLGVADRRKRAGMQFGSLTGIVGFGFFLFVQYFLEWLAAERSISWHVVDPTGPCVLACAALSTLAWFRMNLKASSSGSSTRGRAGRTDGQASGLGARV